MKITKNIGYTIETIISLISTFLIKQPVNFKIIVNCAYGVTIFSTILSFPYTDRVTFVATPCIYSKYYFRKYVITYLITFVN